MTFEKILTDVSTNLISVQQAYEEMSTKDKLKRINYYAHVNDFKKEPLTDGQLRELEAIVDVLQILYTSDIGSPISDSDYDSLQETLIDMGIPRLSGTIEINDSNKLSGTYTTLRGTLDKVYYLTNTETRTNKSREYLDEWIKRSEDLYKQRTGKDIDMNKCKICLQPKFDGVSCTLEYDGKDGLNWITRGDTSNNRASDVSHIMNQFNSVFCNGEAVGIKFEVMMTEDNLQQINSLIEKPYKNSRQVVTSILNSNQPDFKAEYLYPVPLRIIHPGDTVEQIHPMMYEKFPTKICTFGDREEIRQFANDHRYVKLNGMSFRTDGVVMTILDPEIQKVLGRQNNINNFEVAYKFTEESAITKVKTVEFYVSEFGYITPVLVVNDVILKGNTINHISLSNKERFDELDLHFGDEVKVLYDIIPYAIVDASCKRTKYGRKIEFAKVCPRCGEELNLDTIQVQCKNPRCPSRIIGKILNYCNVVRIQNIGYSTLDLLWTAGLLKNGIRSLYKLKKKTTEIQDLEGFGQLKTKKMIAEIEAKRRLKDYEFFGAIGIEGLSTKSFQAVFSTIKLDDFINMVKNKSFDLMREQLIQASLFGPIKVDILVEYLKNTENRVELMKLLQEVKLIESFSEAEVSKSRVKVVFSGCRPNEEMRAMLNNHGYEACDNWNNSAKYLVIPNDEYTSTKVAKAKSKGIKIISLSNITRDIPGLN